MLKHIQPLNAFEIVYNKLLPLGTLFSHRNTL